MLLWIPLIGLVVGSFVLGFVAPNSLRKTTTLVIAGGAWLVALVLLGVGLWGTTSCDVILEAVRYGVAQRPFLFPVLLGLGVLVAVFASSFCGRIWSKDTLPGITLGVIIFVGAMWGLDYMAGQVIAFRC